MQTTPFQDDALKLDDLYSLPRFVELYPDQLSVVALRWQLRHRDKNGLGTACVRLGKKLLISKSRYEAWLGTRAGMSA